jgi:hypothetical protein
VVITALLIRLIVCANATHMKALLTAIIIILIIVIGAMFYHRPSTVNQVNINATTTQGVSSTTGESNSNTNASSSSSTTATSQTTDGTIAFSVPADFGLALNPDQILVKSYIPACYGDFNYCLYYKGSAYKGTNFESAGLSIAKRADLSTERTCLDTVPNGYASSTPDKTNSQNAYSSSVFKNISDAAAGHYSNGTIYRLYVKSNAACYEFMSQIGETQYANYPAGTIKQFTDYDRKTVMDKLTQALAGIRLVSGQKNLFSGL